jgi:predicted site-specific integrase-resolvase
MSRSTAPPTTSRKWLTIEQVLELLPINRATFYRWQAQGLIHAYSVRGPDGKQRRRFYRIEDIESLPQRVNA